MARKIISDDNKLIGRFSHQTVSIGNSLIVWAGAQDGLPKVHDNEEKRKFISNIQQFIPSAGQWVNKSTTGIPPLGVTGYSCTVIKDQLFFFGGYCNHDECYHNSITQLDTINFKWREVEPTNATRSVMRKAYGGMVSFEHDRLHHLLIIGGIGSEPATQQPQNAYINLNGLWCTNEHSLYDLSKKGKWSHPSIIGECMQPACSFAIEKISHTRAILFGGLLFNKNCSNALYLLELSVSLNTVHWQHVKKQSPRSYWPVERRGHASVFVNGTSFVISGGRDQNDRLLPDLWAFNINLSLWNMIPVSELFSQRVMHSVSVLYMSLNCVWLVSVGGLVYENKSHGHHSQLCISDVTNLIQIDIKETWNLCDLSFQQTTEKYKQLQLKGKNQQIHYGHQTPGPGLSIKIAQIESMQQGLMRDLHLKENEVKEFKQKLQEMQMKFEQHRKGSAFQKQQLEKKQVPRYTMAGIQTQKDLPVHIMSPEDHINDYQHLIKNIDDNFDNVAERNLFIIRGNSSQFFDWEEFGLRITIHQGTVLPSQTVGIAIGAFIGGCQRFPEDTELVSAVYAVIFSMALLKPIQLEMQHHVSPAHSNHLCFASALLTNPPYKFQLVEGGVFASGDRYGYIDVCKSQLLSIVTKPFRRRHPNSLAKKYLCQVMYEIKRPGREWLMKIFFCKDLHVIKKYLEGTLRTLEQNLNHLDSTFQFEIIDEHIEFCFDSQIKSIGWSIRPHTVPARVSRETIDNNELLYSSSPYPQLLVTITVTPGTNTDLELSYPIKLKGIKSDNFELNIVLTMDPPASADTAESSFAQFSPGHKVEPAIVLKRNFEKLSELLAVSDNLLAIRMTLYSNELITDETFIECGNTSRSVHERSASLLFALKATIETQPQSIQKLIKALKTKPAFRNIAEKINRETASHTLL